MTREAAQRLFYAQGLVAGYDDFQKGRAPRFVARDEQVIEYFMLEGKHDGVKEICDPTFYSTGYLNGYRE